MNSKIRSASHAGSWYDDNPMLLSKELSQYLSSSKLSKNKKKSKIKIK